MSKPAAVTDQDTSVRIAADVKAELVRLQQEFYAEHGGRITLSEVIRRALADRKPVQP